MRGQGRNCRVCCFPDQHTQIPAIPEMHCSSKTLWKEVRAVQAGRCCRGRAQLSLGRVVPTQRSTARTGW